LCVNFFFFFFFNILCISQKCNMFNGLLAVISVVLIQKYTYINETFHSSFYNCFWSNTFRWLVGGNSDSNGSWLSIVGSSYMSSMNLIQPIRYHITPSVCLTHLWKYITSYSYATNKLILCIFESNTVKPKKLVDMQVSYVQQYRLYFDRS
jgi:hypothetical protein